MVLPLKTSEFWHWGEVSLGGKGSLALLQRPRANGALAPRLARRCGPACGISSAR